MAAEKDNKVKVENKIEVVICGEIITIKSTESADHVQRIARYVDSKMAEMQSQNITATINERVMTQLLALNIADDFFKAQEKITRLKTDNEQFVLDTRRMQEKAKDSADKIKELKEDLAKAKAEIKELKATEDTPPSNILPMPTQRGRTGG